jgi:hypothetical protein
MDVLEVERKASCLGLIAPDRDFYIQDGIYE